MRYNFALGPDEMGDYVPYSHNPRTIYAHVLVINKGEFIGISRIYSTGEIADVFIMDGYRGRGIGMRMLCRLISGISGDIKYWLYTTADNIAAIRLYQRLGMREVAMTPTQIATIKRKNKWLRDKSLVKFIANI